MSLDSKTLVLSLVIASLLVLSCGPSKKLRSIQTGETKISIMGNEAPSADMSSSYEVMRDTLKVKGENGEELFLMKAVKDEGTGEMVANEVLDAAIIVARFRHVAERHGKLDLYFQILVPEALRDSRWQVRIRPKMVMREDTLDLHEVMITGEEYYKVRMRKYQLYQNLLSSILDDYDLIARKREIEIFIERNLPEIYSMRLDSAYVSDEEFTTMYNVSQHEIIEHYGLGISQRRKAANERRKQKAEQMEEELLEKYPTQMNAGNILLDSLVLDDNHGMWAYDYLQTIDAVKGLRSVKMFLSGGVYEGDNKVADISNSDPYTFYLSTLSGFYQQRERYMKKVIERRKAANTTLDIQFKVGKSDIDSTLGNNARELSQIKRTMASLLQNETYDLDSVVVLAGASPEGSRAMNEQLSHERSRAISAYIDAFTRHTLDSLQAHAGLLIDEFGNMSSAQVEHVDVPIRSYSLGEDWNTLAQLVEADTTLGKSQKKTFAQLCKRNKDLDVREQKLKKEDFYRHLADSLYPRLRKVQFEFFLHRKGMVKDTIQTTIPDTVYRRGLEALANMDYEEAVRLLEPYQDFNTAIALMGVDRNHAAAKILTGEPKTAQVEYLFAIIWARMGDEQKAVQYYLDACKHNPEFVHRGNLDPEIANLIKMYNLNAEQFE